MTRNRHQREGRRYMDDHGERQSPAESSRAPARCLPPSGPVPGTAVRGYCREKLRRVSVVEDRHAGRLPQRA